jgi:hypothetical protein
MFSLDTLQITPEVLSLVAGMDEFKGAWRALGTLAPERLRALRHVAMSAGAKLGQGAPRERGSSAG